MAGIGFELRKFLAKDSYTSLISAYGYVGIVTTGPWLLSMLTILILALIGRSHHIPQEQTRDFEVIVVYLIAGSLVLSSIFQHSYTRYIANQCYLKRYDKIVPTLNSIYSVMLLLSGSVGAIAIHFLLPDIANQLKLIINACFVVLCLIWVTTSVLSGLLAYKTIFFAFVGNFLVAITIGLLLHSFGLQGFMISYLCGQFFLLMILIYIIYTFYPSYELIDYDFFRLKGTKIALFFTGIFYNIGIWADKFIFWYSPITGNTIIGGLHASIVYDTPIFIAYLAVIPAMIIFSLHIETDYAEAHEDLYKKICGDNTLSQIEMAYQNVLVAGRGAIYSVLKSGAYILVVGAMAGSGIFIWFNIPSVYLPLFCICLLAASLNVILLATLDIIFYLDKIQHAILITFVFMMTNIIFSFISVHLGIFYFGYGLVASLLVTIMLSFVLLNRDLANLQYETYMLQ